MMVQGQSAVLVVGAGPTGCAAGVALARAGVDVCVVDRASFPRDKTCGDAVSNEGMQLVERLGARNAVLQGPHALVRRAAAVFPDGSRVERSYDEPGYIVPRLHLDDCLRRALQASGARLIEQCRVSELVQEDGRIVGARGPELRWSAPLVIAADGHGSVGLAALGQALPRDRYLAVSTTGYYRNVSFPQGADVADHYFDDELPCGYAWIFPAVDGVSNLGVYIRADAYAAHDRKLAQLYGNFLERARDRLRDAVPVGKPRTWSLPLAPRPAPISAPGLLLAGDAGGFIDPLSGEGIWQGLYTGWLAGEVAASAAAGAGLNAALQQRYTKSCWRAIGRPSRGKARVQEGLDLIVKRKLYRSRLVRAALGFGYRHHALEMTKS